MSKAIHIRFGVYITTLSDFFFKLSRHFLNQSEVKQKPIVIRSHTFSRASCRLTLNQKSFYSISQRINFSRFEA